MFNHKRLITLSIAASMVIPTFSTTTILANESFVEVNDQEEMISLETNNAKSTTELKKTDFDETAINREIFRTETVTKEDGTASETRYFLKSGDYVLSEDVTVPFPIYTDTSANITIDLGTHTLTSTAFESFHLVKQAKLTVTGAKDTENKKEGMLQFTGYGFQVDSGTLKVNNVNIVTRTDSSPYAGTGFYICSEKDSTTTVEVENSSIQNTYTGLMIWTPYPKKDNLPTITLKKVSFDCDGTGIDQFGGSNITIEDCKIAGKLKGVNIGTGGELNISNSAIQSESKDTALHSVGMELHPNNYSSLPFKVKIKDCYSFGDELGLLIDYNTLTTNFPIEFSIDISNSTFESSSDFGFGYRATEEKYKENDPIFQKNPTLLENVTPPQAIETNTSNPINTTVVPYTIRTSSTTPANVEVEENISSVLKTVPGTENVLTKEAQTNTEKKLTELAQKATTQPDIPIYSVKNGILETQNSKFLSYDEYKVELTSPQFSQNKDKSSYTFQAIVTAKLKTNSIICLLIPLTPKTKAEASLVTENFETFSMTESKETVTKTFPLYVELSEVLKNSSNLSSGISGDKIQTILKQIEEKPDLAQIEDDYTLDLAELNNLEKVDLNQTFEMKDIGEVIEISTETPKVIQNRPTSTGSSKPKPKPEAPAEEQPTTPATGTPTSMYRLYNRLTGEHLYTTNKSERDELLTSDTWKDEGQGWTAPSVSDFPVYRLLNPNTGDHHYTTDKNEFDTLPSFGWVAEGIAFFSADKDQEENVILHRIYNPNAQGAGSHHYTTDKNERDSLIAQGWIDEGTAWAGLPTE